MEITIMSSVRVTPQTKVTKKMLSFTIYKKK
jgi:hypothetical protein